MHKGKLFMMHFKRRAIGAIVVALALLAIPSQLELRAQGGAARVNDRQVEQIIRSIEKRSDTFRRSFDAALDRSRLDGTYTEDSVNDFVKGFETATNGLRSRFNGRTAVAGDVENVLTKAAVIDRFLRTNLRQRRVQADWARVSTELKRLATAYNVVFDFNGSLLLPSTIVAQRPYRLSDAQVEVVLRRIETKSDTFRRSLDRALDRSRLDNTGREDNINQFVTDFENSTDTLKSKFDGRTSVALDVSNVLIRAARIDDFMQRNLRRNTVTQRDWRSLRTDLNILSNYYSVPFNLDNRRGMPSYSSIGLEDLAGGPNDRFTGTYRLNTFQSENARAVVERTTRTERLNRFQMISRLESRLNAPTMLAVERRGERFVLASTVSPQITLDADGRERIESYPNGRVSRVRATVAGDTLTIVSNGDRANDFSVVFRSIDGGRRMLVTRGLFVEGLDRMVEVKSYYDRTSEAAQFNIFENSRTTPVSFSGVSNYIVPNGTLIRASSTTAFSTRTARDGDRFTMIVKGPSQFAGAVIEGFVSNPNRSGRITGRSEMNLNYESIRTPDNRVYQFAGVTENLRVSSGTEVRVDNEGTVKEDASQTSRTISRTAIGTGVGALIGALLGGGDGAVVGATLGAGTGIGSVYLQGRDHLIVPSGTEFSIRATNPARN